VDGSVANRITFGRIGYLDEIFHQAKNLRQSLRILSTGHRHPSLVITEQQNSMTRDTLQLKM
jgi:hypothetical protein